MLNQDTRHISSFFLTLHLAIIECRNYARFEQVVHISAPRSGFTGPEAKPRDSKLAKGRYGHNLLEPGINLIQ